MAEDYVLQSPCKFFPPFLLELPPSQLCQQQRPWMCFHISDCARSGISTHNPATVWAPAVSHSGKPLLLCGWKIYIPVLSISLRNLSYQSHRHIHFPTTIFITKNGGLCKHYQFQWDTKQVLSGLPSHLRAASRQRWKHNWILSKYAMSRFKFSTALNRPFWDCVAMTYIFFQAWCSDLPFKQGNWVLVNTSLGWIRVKQYWINIM